MVENIVVIEWLAVESPTIHPENGRPSQSERRRHRRRRSSVNKPGRCNCILALNVCADGVVGRARDRDGQPDNLCAGVDVDRMGRGTRGAVHVLLVQEVGDVGRRIDDGRAGDADMGSEVRRSRCRRS